MANLTEAENHIGKATVIIAVFSLLAKILGVVRDAVFSHQFGTGAVVDAYFAAFRVPDFIYNLLILGTFTVAFIPVFSEYLIKNKDQANKLASSIINVTLLMMLVLSFFAFIFINPLVHAIAPGFQGKSFDLTKLFTQIFLLSPILLTLSSIVSSMLNTYKRFTLVALAPVIYNLSIILGALVLYPMMGPKGLAFGVVLGAFLHFIIQVPQLFQLGFRYSFTIDYKNRGFIKFWKLYWPRIFSMGTGQITSLIASIFGSFLGTGALAVFYYANNLQSVFLSIFAISFSIAIFPLMSDLFNKNDFEGLKDVLAKTTIQILFFILPLSVLMLVLRAQMVRLILGIGQNTNFTFANTRLVSLTLGLFVVSLFAQGLVPLFTRAFYAMQNTLIPVVISFITIGINVVATYFGVVKFGVPGIAIAFSITSIINLILLVVQLRSKIGHIHDEYLIVNSLKIVISSLVAGSAAYTSLYIIAPLVNMYTYFGVFTQGFVSGVVGVVVYIFFTWVLGMSEAHDLVKLSKNLVIRLSRPFNILWNWWV